MEGNKPITHVWLKYRIIKDDGEELFHEMKVSLEVYKTISRDTKIKSLTTHDNDEITKDIYLALLAYAATLKQISLRYRTQ